MKKKVSIVLFIIFSAFVGQAMAASWQKVYSCENGTAYIDVDIDDRQSLQLVFKGAEMLTRMRDTGFASPQFGDSEFVRGGHHAQIQQVSPTETYARWINGVFYPQDFKDFIWQNFNGYAIEAERVGDTLVLRRYQVSAGQSCPDPSDMECRGGTNHSTWIFLSDYVLKNCFLN